ncbi:MAG: methylenetetrahydrofolate reductase [NAD(P)H] [Chloroflexi bacterium]|nr:methylenetetrahydrofolate reductase [NAD(P)H] [Chloroflexota bacterium]MYD49511.1 methylenetetrahydrofolate reductase [NAD(P)H] [Chloroflexota bacterium]
MKIRKILNQQRTISFEFFPPREADGVPGVIDVVKDLQRFNPDFVSVTYGAGGGTRAFTEEITMRLKAETDLDVMAHLTCVAQNRADVHGVLQRLQTAGIENVIALRGDRPPDLADAEPGPDEFPHATDLITHIRDNFDFGIAGACYPEGHTESESLDTDIAYARMKQDLGADFLITQLFYDNAYFYDLLDRAAAAGINIPIIPGVLPILSTPQIRRFTSLCGATIPTELDVRLERYADDNRAVREIGIEHATRQAEDLWANGVPGIHFYVLNRRYSVSHILESLNINGHNGK